jgi:hypothetical protein
VVGDGIDPSTPALFRRAQALSVVIQRKPLLRESAGKVLFLGDCPFPLSTVSDQLFLPVVARLWHDIGASTVQV